MEKLLRKHIAEADKQAKEKFEIQMLEKNLIDENLKNIAPLRWGELMNNYKYHVEEKLF